MSYISKHGNGLMGFGDTGGAVCRTGPAQFSSGNWWVPVKDASGKAYNLMQTTEILALPMCGSGGSAGSGWLDSLIKGATDVLKTKLTPAPVTNITTTTGGGMSNTTKIAIAGGAVIGGVLLLRALKKR
jgi:hypothetical protein